MFSSHSLIQNALVNNDHALVNVIKQSLNLKFAKSKKVIQDYLLKRWFKRRKLLEILMQKTFIIGVATGTKRTNILLAVM